MAVKTFIATIWSARLLESLKNLLVYGAIVNTDYEGEIKSAGDTVKVNTIGSITIGDYEPEPGTGEPEDLNVTDTTLVIDQKKFFNFKVEDIDKQQAKASLVDGAMLEAAYGLTEVMDKFIASHYIEVPAENMIGTDEAPITITITSAYDTLVDVGIKLDEANTPSVGRYVVVPAWYHGMLLKDARFTKDLEVLKTGLINGANGSAGLIGIINGMNVYKSNNVPNTNKTKYKIMAGYKGTISFASQILSIEAYRPEKSFSDAVKGLNVYGAKVMRPKNLVVLTANDK